MMRFKLRLLQIIMSLSLLKQPMKTWNSTPLTKTNTKFKLFLNILYQKLLVQTTLLEKFQSANTVLVSKTRKITSGQLKIYEKTSDF